MTDAITETLSISITVETAQMLRALSAARNGNFHNTADQSIRAGVTALLNSPPMTDIITDEMVEACAKRAFEEADAAKMDGLPKGSRAVSGPRSWTDLDDWERNVILRVTRAQLVFVAPLIAEQAARREREACAQLHESINPASDEERHNGDPGAGAMAAVIEYRDAIRKRGEG